MLSRASAAFVLFLLVWVPSSHRVVRSEHIVAPGIDLIQETSTDPESPLAVHCIRVNLKSAGVRVRAELARDVVMTDEPDKGREPVGQQARRLGAAAAVNADFFPFTGDPLGLMVRNGELLSESLPHRAAFGLTADGRAVMGRVTVAVSLKASGAGDETPLDGINRLPGENDAVLLTSSFARTVQLPPGTLLVSLKGVERPKLNSSTNWTVTSIEPEAMQFEGADGKGALAVRGRRTEDFSKLLRLDQQVAVKCTTTRTDDGKQAEEWDGVEQAVGGGPWLVRNGMVFVDGTAEKMNEKTFVQARHPRTAVGVTAEGALLLVVVDGRQPFSRGVTLPELADIMLKLGAVNAINLDGGGSSEMSVRGLTVNGPSDGKPRPVANGLFVYADAPNAATEKAAAEAPAKAGEPFTLPMGAAEGAGWFGTVQGTAYVSPAGRVYPRSSGTLTVVKVSPEGSRRWSYSVAPATPSPPKSR